MTTQGATFNMHGQLYREYTNVTALFSSPVVSALGSESNNLRVQPPSRTSESNNKLVLVEARRCVLETCRKKKSKLCF